MDGFPSQIETKKCKKPHLVGLKIHEKRVGFAWLLNHRLLG